jgi:rhomboid protease GluP
MANCLTCGRELPAFSFGERSDICAECRRAAVSLPVASLPKYVPRAVAVRRTPVTTALLGLNVAVFLAMILTGVSPLEPSPLQVLKWGANWGPLSLGTQPWRMLASNYIHFGIVHILLNMWCLWNLGLLAERIFDPWTYILTYTACGLGGSLASLWWHPMVIGAGASGAIFGLAGALIAALYLGKLPIPKAAMRGTLKSLLAFAGYNLFFGAAVGGIDNSAHIGGLVTGLALGAILAKHLMSPTEIRRQFRLYVFIGVAIVLLAAGHLVRQRNGYVTALADALQKRHPQNVVGDQPRRPNPPQP